ncbi:glycosyltransferase family A protein [Massilia sp. Se16.2.3]|uniref:glycosyltransferase family A protein n=1 Tax=Massilia sp. Se16.2.3 TaxID=2709303 RepID=UPI001E421006|nr:glycosyltransferase family A protein [Massilia sp. Se16.2.3]
MLRYLRARGIAVDTLRHLPRRGMAEQRAFLLAQASAPACLFLDDDVIVEPGLLARLHTALRAQGCGFVGSAVHGLSYLGQLRPEQESIEFWDGPVVPETVRPGTAAWARHHLHSAANLFHVQSRLAQRSGPRLYRVAWIGGCVLFDAAKLRDCGGFDFWQALPAEHCGEDVLAQLRVMERYGGCGILPSGAYHMELPTTVTMREVDAPHVLLGLPPGGSGTQTGTRSDTELDTQIDRRVDGRVDTQIDTQTGTRSGTTIDTQVDIQVDTQFDMQVDTQFTTPVGAVVR